MCSEQASHLRPTDGKVDDMDLDTAISLVRARILEAFQGVVPPLDEWSVDPGDPESTALQRAFAGHDWQTVQHDLLRYHVTILPLFQPETFRYFLPAFMLDALSTADTDGAVAQFVVYALRQPDMPSQADWWQDRMNGFTPQQIAAIREFLCLTAGRLCQIPDEFDEAETALQRYWLTAGQ